MAVFFVDTRNGRAYESTPWAIGEDRKEGWPNLPAELRKKLLAYALEHGIGEFYAESMAKALMEGNVEKLENWMIAMAIGRLWANNSAPSMDFGGFRMIDVIPPEGMERTECWQWLQNFVDDAVGAPRHNLFTFSNGAA